MVKSSSNTDQSPQGIHILSKPIGYLCNLDCKYCFYLEKKALYPGKRNFSMANDVLEAYVRKNIAAQGDIPEVPFVWQGGEPTLRGLDFYKKAVEYQKKYANGKKITNALQTNGTKLDDDWCRFLADNDFLVGLSLDGPQELHNYYRVDRGGKPTFNEVMRGLDYIRKHNVSYNILACVNRYNSLRPLDVYDFFRSEGITFIQFNPVVERKPDSKAQQLGLSLAVPPQVNQDDVSNTVTEWSVESESWGDFMIQVFDVWIGNNVGTINIQNFEWALASFLGMPAAVCIFAKTCGRAIALEHNGDLFSCDHYVYPDYKLGNIVSDDPKALVESQQQMAFGEAKDSTLPRYCRECKVLEACQGECPKKRFIKTPDGELGLNYLCAGYKKYFTHILPYMKAIAQLLKQGQPASMIMDYTFYKADNIMMFIKK